MNLYFLTFSCRFAALSYCKLRCFLTLSAPVNNSSAGLNNLDMKPCHGFVLEYGYQTDSWSLSDPEFELVSRFDFDSEPDYRSVPSSLHLSSVPLLPIKFSFSSYFLLDYKFQ